MGLAIEHHEKLDAVGIDEMGRIANGGPIGPGTAAIGGFDVDHSGLSREGRPRNCGTMSVARRSCWAKEHLLHHTLMEGSVPGFAVFF
jgi:hypothetical protein